MSPEEQKLFDEFKVAIDATQLHTYNKYIKPEIDNLLNKTKRQNLFIIVISISITILTITFFSAESHKVVAFLSKIITHLGL